MKALKLFILFFVGVNARIDDFMKTHLEQGTHKHDSVPEVIRGENFTEANLIKYFDGTWMLEHLVGYGCRLVDKKLPRG